MMSVHINNQYAKNLGISKNLLLAVRTVMHQEQFDMVAGDFNGAAQRRRSGDDQLRDSTVEGSFANTTLPILHGPAVLVPGGVPRERSDVCGFITPLGSETEWHIRMHGAFDILHEILGTDQSCHHEVWIHLLQVNARAHLEMGDIGAQPSGKGTVRTTTSRSTWPSTQEIHVVTRVRKRDNLRRAPCAHNKDVRRVNS